MISVPGGTGDIADAMISASQMIYASRINGTDIISYLQSKYIIRQRRISYRVSDISLKNITFYDIILMKEGVFMSENKLLDLSFEFAIAIVNLVDGVTAPKSSYMTDQLARYGYISIHRKALW